MKFDEILNNKHGVLGTLSVCKAADFQIFETIKNLYENTEMSFHLVDDENRLKEHLCDFKLLDESRIHIHHASSDEEAARTAVSIVANGTCNLLMKGLISTSTILKEVLKKEYNLVHNKLMSHVTLCDLPNYHKAVIISDCGMNISPSKDQKIGIIKNAVDTAQRLGISKPKVSILASVEKVNSKIKATVDAYDIKNDESIKSLNAVVDGPLQFDLSISKQAVKVKQLDSNVAGDADILITPDLNSGNILYKSLVFTANAKVAAILVGAKVPIIITSRADSPEVKYNSTIFAAQSLN